MNKNKVIKTARNRINREKFEEQVDRVKRVLEKREKYQKLLDECDNWLKLYKEGKEPKLDGDVLTSEDFNEVL